MGLKSPPLALAALAVLAAPAAAQEAVRSVALAADLNAESGGARVRVRYELVVPAGEVVVPFELLGFGDATAERFVLEGADEAVALAPLSGSRRRAEVRLSGDGSGTLRLDATYRVERAVRREEGAVRAEIPVLVVAWPPAEALPGHFTAEVRVPPDWRVLEGFPSGMRPAGGPDSAGAWLADLAVTPSLVSLRGRDDGAWRPALPLVLDVLILLVLGGFGWLGWLHLRGVARRAAGGAA